MRCRSREFMCSVYIAHIRPFLEFSSFVWNTGYVGDCKLLEFVQRRWTKHVDVKYWDHLSSLNLFSVKGRLLRADLIKYFKIFNGLSAISPPDFFFSVVSRHLYPWSSVQVFQVACLHRGTPEIF